MLRAELGDPVSALMGRENVFFRHVYRAAFMQDLHVELGGRRWSTKIERLLYTLTWIEND